MREQWESDGISPYERQKAEQAYPLYREFKIRYRDWILSLREPEWAKRWFLEDFRIRTEENFVKRICRSSERRRLQRMEKWEAGFDAWLEQKMNVIRSIVDDPEG